jgi:hypothetical protein
MTDDIVRDFSETVRWITHPNNAYGLVIGMSPGGCPYIASAGMRGGGMKILNSKEASWIAVENPEAMAEARSALADLQKKLLEEPVSPSCIPMF